VLWLCSGWSANHHGRLEPRLHLVVADETGLLMHELASGEDGEVRDAADVVAGGELSVLVGVDLEDDGLSSQIGSGAGDFGSCHAARATPLCPEIDEYRHAGMLNHVVKKVDIRRKRFVDGVQCILAGAAAACVCQVRSGDAVFLATVVAGTNGGHGRLLLSV